MLQDRFKEYLEQQEIVKGLNKDLRDTTRNHELYREVKKAQDEYKKLKSKLENVTEIALIKEKRDGARERQNLLKDILIAEMQEEGKQEIQAEGKKARFVTQIKFEKAE